MNESLNAEELNAVNLIVSIQKAGVQRIERFELSEDNTMIIGRAWNCDIVIDDQYIDPQHLSISLGESGQLLVADMKTKNGSRIAKSNIKATTVYSQGDSICIGDAQIKVYNEDIEVAEAISFDFTHKFSRKFKSPLALALITIFGILAALSLIYFRGTDEANLENAIETIIRFTGVTLVWSLLAGFIGKIFRHEANFSLHWVIVCLITIIVSILSYILEILNFNINGALVVTIAEYCLGIAVVGFFVYATLSFTTRMAKFKKMILAGFCTLAPVVYTIASPMLKEERDLWSYTAEPDVSNLIPAFKWRDSGDYQQHENNVDELFAEFEKSVNSKGD